MSRFFASALVLGFGCGLSGCTLITDVDRSKIAAPDSPAPSATGDAGLDGGAPMAGDAGSKDAGKTAGDAGGDDGGAGDSGTTPASSGDAGSDAAVPAKPADAG
ncbi:MAG: hypothetical protein RJA70_4853 [Pseudomonadota bacterium]|jgi:hypothetical protein